MTLNGRSLFPLWPSGHAPKPSFAEALGIKLSRAATSYSWRDGAFTGCSRRGSAKQRHLAAFDIVESCNHGELAVFDQPSEHR